MFGDCAVSPEGQVVKLFTMTENKKPGFADSHVRLLSEQMTWPAWRQRAEAGFHALGLQNVCSQPNVSQVHSSVVRFRDVSRCFAGGCVSGEPALCRCHLSPKNNSVLRGRTRGEGGERWTGTGGAGIGEGQGTPPASRRAHLLGGRDCLPATLVRPGLPKGPAEGALVTSHLLIKQQVWQGRKAGPGVWGRRQLPHPPWEGSAEMCLPFTSPGDRAVTAVTGLFKGV